MGRNIPLFIAFRVLFNARFYYPVLGVLFLDLGLSLEQYALLNVVWAVAILTLEIPSGALADAIGRKRMVVLASGLMVAEIAVFAFAPSGGGDLLFWLLVLNRILSGAAEACASGADEALAYDSLPEETREAAWPAVLATLMRWQSAAFFVAMLTGAALFDRDVVSNVVGWIGVQSPDSTTRWPVFATLGTALACFCVALAMREPANFSKPAHAGPREALANIAKGARHVFHTPRIFSLILVALVCDSFIRLFLTFASNFNRLIELPEFAYGLVGSGMALLGFAAAPIAKNLVSRLSAPKNLAIVVVAIVIGLLGASMARPLWGVWVIVPLGMSMSLLQFFVSNYLNSWTDSDLRATVLSFRGVAMNLGYGTIGLAFAALSQSLRQNVSNPEENSLFAKSLLWLPPAFFVCIVVVGITAALLNRRRTA